MLAVTYMWNLKEQTREMFINKIQEGEDKREFVVEGSEDIKETSISGQSVFYFLLSCNLF